MVPRVGLMSLRARLLLGFVAIALVLVGADLVLAANVQKSLVDQIDQRLDSAIGFSSRGFPNGFPGPRPPSGSVTNPENETNPRFTEFFLAELDSERHAAVRGGPDPARRRSGPHHRRGRRAWPTPPSRVSRCGPTRSGR